MEVEIVLELYQIHHKKIFYSIYLIHISHEPLHEGYECHSASI